MLANARIIIIITLLSYNLNPNLKLEHYFLHA